MGTQHSLNMLAARSLLAMLLCSSVIRTASSLGSSKGDAIRGAYFGALVSDALSLGSHYEYDAHKIKLAYKGQIERFMAPGESMGGMTHGVGWGERNYHPGAKAGDQTDYGEYNVLVLEHLAVTADPARPFSVPEFLPRWAHRISNGWNQWVCSQTRQAYQKYNEGVTDGRLGGNSNAMALRFSAAFAYHSTEDEVVDTAIKTMFTHSESTAQMGAEFFARVTFRILHNGLTPLESITQVSAASPRWIQDKVAQALQKVQEATDPTSELFTQEYVDDLAVTSMARLWDVGKSEPIKVGKASPTEGTLPASVYLICKYNNLMQASKANAMVGGDNASRAIAIGMVLGAY